MRPPRTIATPLLAALLTLLVGLSPALAADAPVLGDQTTDLAGAFDGREPEVDAALARLLADHDIQLFVLFVETTDGEAVEAFGQAVVERNSLGVNDALLLVALDDRTDWIWVSDSLEEISTDEVDTMLVEDLEPRLRDGDFAGGAIAVAESMGAAISGEPAPTTTPGGGTGAGSSDGGGVVLGVLLVAGGAGLVGWWFMRRRQAAAAAEERDRRTGQLAREANALLIATDERVRDAGEELGFVEAEYGAEEVAPLKVAIDKSRAELREAFAVRQQLDDAEPETPEERATMLAEIVERSKRAQAALDAEVERIQRLRDLERDAPAILAALGDRIAAAEARLPAADAAMAELSDYAPSTSAAVAGNLTEARKGLTGAREAVQRGTTALSSEQRRAAARQARTAEAGLAGATGLIDAVEKLAASARQAAVAIPDELAAAAADIGEARRALAGAPVSARHDQALAAAEDALRAARAAAGASPMDPVESLRLATAAHRAADDILATARQDAEQRARFAAALDSSIATAEAHIERAENYVAGRRGGIGRTARTRLAEARRELERAAALRPREPQQAMQAAGRAQQLADEAYREAGSDFDAWNSGGPGWGGQRGGDQVGSILGGILTGILLGGRGGGGGGWGGTPWGSSGPTINLPGGWGGGRGRGGSWGGGWSGGGGGRSRGGRW
jgi:hypothetical protein